MNGRRIEAVSELLAERPESVVARVNDMPVVLAVKVLSEDGALPSWLEAARREETVQQAEHSGYRDRPCLREPNPLTAEELRTLLQSAAGRVQ